MPNYEKDKVLKEFLEVQKSEETITKYKTDMNLFCSYIVMTPTEIKELRLRQEKSDKKEEKYFFEDKLKAFWKWLWTDYKGTKGKAVSKSSASSMCVGVRGFFKHIRSQLKMQKGDIPQPTKAKGEHVFTLEELQMMFRVSSYRQRAILCCGVHFGMGAQDFVRLRRDYLERLIEQVEKGLKKYPVEFSTVRRKTGAEQVSFLTGEIADTLTDYWNTYKRQEREVIYEEGDPNIPKGTRLKWCFPKEKNGEPYKDKMSEENLTDILRTIWKQAFPNLELPKIRWHLLRKFLLSRMTEANLDNYYKKVFTGKTVPQDMDTYITVDFKEAWQKVAPKISLTGITNKRMAIIEDLKGELKEQRTALRVIAKYVAKELSKKLYEKVLRGEEGEGLGLMRVDPELKADIEALEEFAKKKEKEEGKEE